MDEDDLLNTLMSNDDPEIPDDEIAQKKDILMGATRPTQTNYSPMIPSYMNQRVMPMGTQGAPNPGMQLNQQRLPQSKINQGNQNLKPIHKKTRLTPTQLWSS
jgi:hypothetical protein